MAITLVFQRQIRPEETPRSGDGSGNFITSKSSLEDDLDNIRLAIEHSLGPSSTWNDGASTAIKHNHSGGTNGPSVLNTTDTPLVWSGSGVIGSGTAIGGTQFRAAPWNHQHPNYLLGKYVYRGHTSSIQSMPSTTNTFVATSIIGSSVAPISSSVDASGVVSEAMTTATNGINKVLVFNPTTNTALLDGSSREIYGRVRTTGSGPSSYVHNLDFYVNISGTETAATLASGTQFYFKYVRQYEWDTIIASGSHKDVLLSGGGGGSGGGGSDPITDEHLLQLRADLYTTPSWTATGTPLLATPLETQIANHIADTSDPHGSTMSVSVAVQTPKIDSTTSTLTLGITGASGNAVPETDNIIDLGTTALRWKSVHAALFQADVASSSANSYLTLVSGESFGRLLITADGKYGVGPGSATRDSFIERTGVATFLVTSTLNAATALNAPSHGTLSGDMTLAPSGTNIIPVSDATKVFGTSSLRWSAMNTRLLTVRPTTTGDAITSGGFTLRVNGETFDRFQLLADGKVRLGTGSAAPDADIWKSASNQISFFNNVGTAWVDILTGNVIATGYLQASDVLKVNGTSNSWIMGNLGLGINTPVFGLHQIGGALRLKALATPSTPSVTPQGTTGSTSYTYYIVAVDRNGKRSLVSAAGNTTTGNATLTGSNFNRITWSSVVGAVSYDILKTNTSTKVGSTVSLTFDDTGGSTTAYTAPTQNETAHSILDGRMIVGGFGIADASLAKEMLDIRGGYALFDNTYGIKINDNIGVEQQILQLDSSNNVYLYSSGNAGDDINIATVNTGGNIDFIINSVNALRIVNTTGYSGFGGVSTPDHRITLKELGGFPIAAGIAFGDVGVSQVELYQSAANVLSLGADDSFNIPGGGFQIGGTTIITSARNLQNINNVNTNLVPGTTNLYDIGSVSNEFRNGYFQNLYINGTSVLTNSNVTGTTGKIAKFTGINTVGDSLLTESGNAIGFSNASPSYKFHIVGSAYSTLTTAATFALENQTVGANAANYLVQIAGRNSGGTISSFKHAAVDINGDSTAFSRYVVNSIIEKDASTTIDPTLFLGWRWSAYYNTGAAYKHMMTLNPQGQLTVGYDSTTTSITATGAIVSSGSGASSIAGNLGIGITTPTTNYKLEIVGGNGILAQDNITNSTLKIFRYGMRHYTNAEEPFAFLTVQSQSTANLIYYGGGTNQGNNATSHVWFASANNITQGGVSIDEQMRLTSSGLMVGVTSIPSGVGFNVGTVVSAVTGYRVNNTAPLGQFLRGDGTNFVASGIQPSDLTGIISGTTNFIAKFTGGNTLGNSLIQDNGFNIGINELPVTQIGTVMIRNDNTPDALLFLRNLETVSNTTSVIGMQAQDSATIKFYKVGDAIPTGMRGYIGYDFATDLIALVKGLMNVTINENGLRVGSTYTEITDSSLTFESQKSLNVATGGYRIGNAAASGKYLRGNGTDFVASDLIAGDFSSIISGTTGNIPKFTGTNTIGNSVMSESSSIVSITNGGFKVLSSTTGIVGLSINKGGDSQRNWLRWSQVNSNWQSGFRASPYTWVLEYQSNASPTDDTGWTSVISAFTGGNVSIGKSTINSGVNLDSSGVINADTGYRVNNLAASGKYLRGDGTNFVPSDLVAGDFSGIISGTTNFISRFTSANTIGNSIIQDNGTTIGISTAPSTDILTINGNITLSGSSARSINFRPGSNIICNLDINIMDISTVAGNVRYFRSSNTTGRISVDIFKGDNTGTFQHSFAGNADSYVAANNSGFSVGTSAVPPSGVKLHTSGVINATTGYRVNNVATSGQYLRGNGTNFVSSTIQAADLSAGISGTTSNIAKFTGANTVGNSVMTESASIVSIANGGFKSTSSTTGIVGLAINKGGDVQRNWLRWNQGTANWQSGFRSSPYSWVLEYQTNAAPDDDTSWTSVIFASTAGNVAIGKNAINSGVNLDSSGVINADTGYRINNAAATGNFLRGNGTNFVSSTIQATDLSAGISGTVGKLSKFTSANVLGDSIVTESGGFIGINQSSPAYLLHLNEGHVGFSYVANPSTPSASLAGAGAGNLSNGVYTYKVTYVNAAGIETQASAASANLTVVNNTLNGQVTLTIPVSSDSTVTKRRIYRTLVNQNTHYFVNDVNNNTSTTFTDNIADASLAAQTAPEFNLTAGSFYSNPLTTPTFNIDNSGYLTSPMVNKIRVNYLLGAWKDNASISILPYGRLVNPNNQLLMSNITGSFSTTPPTGYTLYNNSGGAAVGFQVVQDTGAPNNSGRVMRIQYDDTIATNPSPGYGGFLVGTTVNSGDSISATNRYKPGSRILYTVWAKLPIGKYLHFATNSGGFAATYTWISDRIGTGKWKRYTVVRVLGESIFGSAYNIQGYFYTANDLIGTATYGVGNAFTWDVAACTAIAVDEDSYDAFNFINIGFKPGITQNFGELLNINNAFLATDSGGVSIGRTTAPVTSLDIYNANDSATLTNFTQAATGAGIRIESDFTAGNFIPGITWTTSNNNTTKPKAGVLVATSNSGTFIYLGTSNNYGTGLTNTGLAVDYTGKVGILQTIGTQTAFLRELDVNGSIRQSNLLFYTPTANAYLGIVKDNGASQALKVDSISCTNSYADTTPASGIGYFKNGVGIGSGAIAPRAKLDLDVQAPGINTAAQHIRTYTANKGWPIDLVSIYDANLVDHYLLFNGILNGTKAAPTHAGNTSNAIPMGIRHNSSTTISSTDIIGATASTAGATWNPLLRILSSGNVSLNTSTALLAVGMAVNTGLAKLQLPTGTGEVFGITVGTGTIATDRVNLYRSAAGVWKTDNSFIVDKDLTVNGIINIGTYPSIGRYIRQRFIASGTDVARTTYVIAQDPIVIMSAAENATYQGANAPALRKLKVYYDGVLMEEGTATAPQDYSYDSPTKTITFVNTNIPRDGARVVCEYEFA